MNKRLLAFVLTLMAGVSQAQNWQSGSVDPAFNRRDVGNPDIMPGRSIDQDDRFLSLWYTNPMVGKPLLSKNALVANRYSHGYTLVDSTGHTLLSSYTTWPTGYGQGFVPYQQIASGRILGFERYYTQRSVDHLLYAVLPSGEIDLTYDSTLVEGDDEAYLYTFTDGRVLIATDAGRDSSFMYLIKRNGGYDARFRPLKLKGSAHNLQAAVHGSEPNSIYIVAESQSGNQGFELMKTDTLGSYLAHVVANSPVSGLPDSYIKILTIQSSGLYLLFSGQGVNHVTLYRYTHNGQIDPGYIPHDFNLSK